MQNNQWPQKPPPYQGYYPPSQPQPQPQQQFIPQQPPNMVPGESYKFPMSGTQYPLQNPVPMTNIQPQIPLQNPLPTNDIPLPTKGFLDIKCPNLFYHNQMAWFQFNSNKVFFYDFVSKKWIPGVNANNYQFISYFRTAQYPDGSILLTGGSDARDIILNTVTLYHTDGRITAKKYMRLPRRAHSCIYNSGYVYVFGGVNNKGFLQDCEKYSLLDGTWSDIDKMSKKRTLTSCCNFNMDSIFVFGGYSDDEKKELDFIERFDIKTNKFFAMAFKLLDRLQNPFVIQINPSEILIMGGYNDNIGDSSNVCLMDVYFGKFRPLETMKDKGWGIYPPIFSGGVFCSFMTGEEQEPPDCIEYILKI